MNEVNVFPKLLTLSCETSFLDKFTILLVPRPAYRLLG